MRVVWRVTFRVFHVTYMSFSFVECDMFDIKLVAHCVSCFAFGLFPSVTDMWLVVCDVLHVMLIGRIQSLLSLLR